MVKNSNNVWVTRSTIIYYIRLFDGLVCNWLLKISWEQFLSGNLSWNEHGNLGVGDKNNRQKPKVVPIECNVKRFWVSGAYAIIESEWNACIIDNLN